MAPSLKRVTILTILRWTIFDLPKYFLALNMKPPGIANQHINQWPINKSQAILWWQKGHKTTQYLCENLCCSC